MATSWRSRSSIHRNFGQIGMSIAQVATDVPRGGTQRAATLLVMFHDRTDAGRKLAKRLTRTSP